MFFVVSKSLWFFTQPSSLITLTLLAGLGLAGNKRYGRHGLRLARFGLLALVVAGLSPLGNMLILPLEQRFPSHGQQLPAGRIDGIILLGGAEDGRIAEGRQSLTLNAAAERVTETLRLARAMPGTRVIICGGSGAVLRAHSPGGPAVASYLRVLGISEDRLVLESESRTTYENALFAKRIINPQPGQRFVLVTSAAHMPRSVGAFRKQGFDVIPWPADFRTAGAGDARRFFDAIARGLRRVDDAVQEWVGLIAYRLLDRSDTLFPALRGQ